MRVKATRDHAVVASLVLACFPAETSAFDPCWDGMWVGYEDGLAVGFACASLQESKNGVVYAKHELAGVTRPYRGGGRQRQLIRTRERWAVRNSAKWIETYVMPWNAPSLCNLLKLDYRIVSPESEDDREVITLKKILAESE